MVVFSSFDCEVLSRLSLVFCFGNGTLLIFFKLSSHKWDFSLSMADIYRAVSIGVTGPRPRCEQPWVQATPSIMRDICQAVSNVVTGPLPTISIMGPGNPIYELLYEFKLHFHLLGNLRHHFYNNGFRSRETVNIKYCINNSGICGPTWHLPLKNN